MTTHFLDATGGSDSNDGLSQGTAWRTLAKLSAITLNAGDTVKFKNGEIFRDSQYNVLASGLGGTALNPITFEPYVLGGALPVLDGGTPVTGWTRTATANVWQASIASEVNGVSVDGTLLWFTGGQQVTPWLPTTQDPATIDVAHPWTWQNGVLYIFSATDPNSRTVIGNVHDVMGTDGYGGLVFRELQFSHAQDRAAIVRNRASLLSLAPITFDTCTFTLNGFRRNSGCIAVNSLPGGGRITNCTFDDNSNDGAFITGSPDWQIDHNTIRRIHRWESDGFQFQGNTTGVTLRGNDGLHIHHNDIDIVGSDTNKGCVIVNGPIGRYGWIHDNTLRGGNFGVQIGQSGLVVERNVCHEQTGQGFSSGLYIAGDTWATRGGVVRQNVVWGSTIGINVTLKGFDKRSYLIAHNTCVDCAAGLQVLDPFSGAIVNNIFWSPSAANEHVRVEAIVSGETLVLDNNVFGPEGLSKYGKWFGAAKVDLTTWRAGSGGDAHSLAVDPLFTDATGHDYTLQPRSPALGAARLLHGAGQLNQNIGAN